MRALFLISIAVALTGMAESDPDFGYSVRRSVVAQAVDMAPNYAGTPIEGSSGVRALDAQRQYLKGNVKKLGKIDGKVDITGSTEASGTGRAAPAPEK